MSNHLKLNQMQPARNRTSQFARFTAGFTMVELLVTVMIIGGLAGLAIPAYQKMLWRERQTEARNSLTQVYIAERGFYVDQATYTACLSSIGVKAENEVRYYIFGYGSGDASAVGCGPNNGQPCNGYSFDRDGVATQSCTVGSNVSFFPATASSNKGDSVPSTQGIIGSGTDPWQATTYTFSALAKGYVSKKGAWDIWQIDNNKNMYNSTSGL